MIQRRTLVKAVIAALAPLSMTSAFAAGGPSGTHIGYQHQGQLGAVDMNPYKIARLQRSSVMPVSRSKIFTCVLFPKPTVKKSLTRSLIRKQKRMAAFLFLGCIQIM